MFSPLSPSFLPVHLAFPSPLPSPLPVPFYPSLLPLIPSLPAHLDLSGSSTGDDLSLLPFCKEPAPPSEGEGLSLDHMSVSEGEWQGGVVRGGTVLDHMSVSEGEWQT